MKNLYNNVGPKLEQEGCFTRWPYDIAHRFGSKTAYLAEAESPVCPLCTQERPFWACV